MKAGCRAAGIAATTLVLFFAASAAASADSCGYKGLAGDPWDVDTNWTCGHVPTTADDVVLTGGDSVLVTAADAVAGTMTLDTGSTLAFANAHKLDVTGDTTLDSGTVTGAGSLNLGGGFSKGAGQLSISNGVTVTPGADSTWDDGDICITNGSILSIAVKLDVAAAAESFNCTSSDSLVSVKAAGSIVVAGGTRTWFSRVDDDGLVKLNGGTLTLGAAAPNTDAGSWSIAAAAAQLTISADRTLGATGALGGPGTLVVNSGTTTVPNGSTFNPAVFTASGGVTTLNGTAPATTLAQVNLTGGTFGGTRSRTITNLAAESGTLSGAQTTTVSGALTKTTAGQLFVNGGVTLSPAVDTTWTAGDICITDGSTFNLAHELDVAAGAGGFNCSSSDSLVSVKQTGLIAIAGGTRTWFSQIDNDGQVRMDAGTLTLSAQSPNTDAGSWNIAAAAAQLTISADRTLGATGALGGPGTLLVNSGTTTVPDNATLNPAVLTSAGGTLNVNGTAPALSLAQVSLAGGTFGGTRNRSIGTLTAQSGTLTGAQTTTVTSSLTKSTAGQLFVNGGVTLSPAVDTTWTAGDICITDGSTFNLAHELDVAAGAGSFNCSSNDSLVSVKQTGLIDVAGGTRTWFSQLDNDGQIKVDAGTLTLGAQSPNTDAGAWSIASGAQLTISADRTLGASGTLGGAGTLQISSGTTTVPDNAALNPAVLNVPGGTLNVNGTSPALTLPQVNLTGGVLGGARNRSIGTLSAQSGTLSGAQTTTVTGSLTKSTAGQVSLTSGVTLNPAIDATWTAGDICITGGSTFNIAHELDVAAGAGSFNCSSNDSLVSVKQTGLIDVAGGTRTWFSQLDNDGQVKLDGGTLALGAVSPNTDAGSWSVGAASQLTLAADRTLAASGALGGAGTVLVSSGATTVPDNATFNPATLTMAGGTLSLDGAGPATTLPQVNLVAGTLGGTRNRSIGTLAAQGGTLTGAQTTTVTTSFTKTTASQLSIGGGITVHPTVDTTWSAGSICMQNAATLKLDHALHVGDAAGTFNCSSSDSLVDVVTGGSIDFAGAAGTWFTRMRNAGAITLATGRSVTFAADFQNVAGGTLTNDGTVGGTITNAGGVLTGGGTFSGDVANTTGTVRPGSSPGTLTVSGDYTQGAGGTLEVEIAGATAGTQFDQLAIGKAANLGGTLAIVRDPAFDPALNQTFQIVTSATRTGNFATITGAAFGQKTFVDSGSTPGYRLVVTGPGAPGAGTVTITGTVEVGRTVTCDEGNWTRNPTFTYQWLRNGGAIADATGRTYVIAAADADRNLSCRVTGTNISGSTQATSAPVHVPPVAPKVTSPAEIKGTPAVGRTLTCTGAAFSGAPTPTVVTSWLRDGKVTGVNGATYAVTATDAGHAIACRATATNTGGSASSTSAALTVPDVPRAGSPAVSGIVAVASTVVCAEGAWSSNPVFSYTWLRDGAPIAGATGRSYAITADDATHQLSCRVRGTTSSGSAEATSAAVTVPAVGPARTADPKISGTAKAGQTLTCAGAAFSGIPAPALAVQWLRDGTAISGATAAAYKVTGADKGHALACRVTATNPGGSASATSAAVNVAKPKPLAGATPQKVATAFGLRGASSCVNRGTFSIRLRAPAGIRIKSVRLKVDGRKTSLRRSGGALVARLDLRKLSKSRFTVTIRVRTRDGRTLTGKLRYRICPKPGSGGGTGGGGNQEPGGVGEA